MSHSNGNMSHSNENMAHSNEFMSHSSVSSCTDEEIIAMYKQQFNKVRALLDPPPGATTAETLQFYRDSREVISDVVSKTYEGGMDLNKFMKRKTGKDIFNPMDKPFVKGETSHAITDREMQAILFTERAQKLRQQIEAHIAKAEASTSRAPGQAQGGGEDFELSSEEEEEEEKKKRKAKGKGKAKMLFSCFTGRKK